MKGKSMNLITILWQCPDMSKEDKGKKENKKTLMIYDCICYSDKISHLKWQMLEKKIIWFTLPEVESITSGEDLPWKTHNHMFTRFFQPPSRSLFILFASQPPPEVWWQAEPQFVGVTLASGRVLDCYFLAYCHSWGASYKLLCFCWHTLVFTFYTMNSYFIILNLSM